MNEEITLRDFLAAQSFPLLVATMPSSYNPDPLTGEGWEPLIDAAYKFADAMIEARK